MLTIAAFCFLGVVLLCCTAAVWGRPGEGIGLPIIAILCFGYLYLWQPLSLVWEGRVDAFLDDRQAGTAVLMAGVMLSCFVWGWRKGVSGRRQKAAPVVAWKPLRLWNFGFAGASVGLVLLLAVIRGSGGFEQAFSKTHGGGISLEGVTAYIHLSPWWMLSGVAMMLTANPRLRPSRWRKLVIALYVAIFVVYAILLSARGYTFGIVAVVAVSYALGTKNRPTIARTAPVWLGAGIAALLIVGYRGVIYLGQDRPEAPSVREAITAANSVNERYAAMRLTGNEFVYGAAVLETVNDTQKYDLGLQWAYVYTLHLIPRVFWPGKPSGFDSPGISGDEITETTGIQIADGAAPGIVADLYMNFGPLAALFLFLVGLGSGKLFVSAQFPGNPLPVIAYTMLCALSLNLFAQGFASILVFYPYSLAPMLLYGWSGRLARSRKGNRTYWGPIVMRGPKSRALPSAETVLPTF